MADLTRGLDLGPFPTGARYADAVAADEADELAGYRNRFKTADPLEIYLDGNSLGRLPHATSQLLADVVDRQWGEQLIASWGEHWWDLARNTGNLIAKTVGAESGSVVVADSTSVSLFKTAWAALRSRPDRKRIVTDDLNFPTDIYTLNAAAQAAGNRDVVVVESDGVNAPEDAIIGSIDGNTALVSLSHVSFKSGYLYDMARITGAAREAGAIALWDLSHSVGVVPIDLSEADLAVGCTYKYLNGGPGSPAFIYVNPRLGLDNPLAGWWGHTEPFAFELDYRPAHGITQFQTGTMPILSLSAIAPGVELALEAGIDRIRRKSVALTGFLVELAEEVLTPHGYSLASPRDGARRGSHVSIRHPDAWRVNQAMIDQAKVVPDFREPDNIRLGLAPLYTSFVDVHTAVHRIARVTRDDVLSRYPSKRTAVT